MDRSIAWVGAFALLILHLDFWRPSTPELWFGSVPAELGYRVGWMVLAWLYLMFVTSRVWTSEPE